MSHLITAFGACQVRGKDGVGAKMDSMELEKEKGITIQVIVLDSSFGSNLFAELLTRVPTQQCSDSTRDSYDIASLALT